MVVVLFNWFIGLLFTVLFDLFLYFFIAFLIISIVFPGLQRLDLNNKNNEYFFY